jgi:hypothetical protein
MNFIHYKPDDFQSAIDLTDRLREVQISLDSLRTDFALATTEMSRESIRRALIEQEQKQAELVQIQADKFSE